MELKLADWIIQQQKRLDAQPIVGYLSGESAAAEPVAISALAACSYARKDAASTAATCLLEAQNPNGSVSVRLNQEGPFWVTSLACIAWRQFEKRWPVDGKERFGDAYRRGLDYLTQCGGEKIDQPDIFGHNTELVGWPWVLGTHSWLEPTALAWMAMRQCGLAEHPRAIEAARLLVDRQLLAGGANFGNTTVLHRHTRPHVLPSAMCVVAFHQVHPVPQPIAKTARYLKGELNQPLGSLSLAWLIHALVSRQMQSTDDVGIEFDQPLKATIARMQLSDPNPHRQNLLLLALRKRESPLLDIPPMQWKDIKEGTAS